jgi:hypothetical protein
MEIKEGKKEYDLPVKALAEDFDDFNLGWEIGDLYDKNLEIKDNTNNLIELSSKIDELQVNLETMSDTQDEFKEKVFKELRSLRQKQDKILILLESFCHTLQIPIPQ